MSDVDQDPVTRPVSPRQPTPPTPATVPARPSAWNLANTLTVLRILLVPVFAWLLLAHGGTSTTQRLGAFAVFAVAAITDKIDGDLARRRNSVTDFGKVADPIADKALTGTALVGLSLVGVVPWWVTVVIVVREVAVTVMRFVVIRHGVMPASRGGKVKTVLQAAALGLLVFPPHAVPFDAVLSLVAHVLLAAALVVTVVTGVDYAVKAHILRRTSARAVAKRAAREAAREQRRQP
ncbi:CDP-diacylglycerol--glycerol-3-phosphate 3-phosphatidyltransferase [Lapillicoccus jejuensis]|uniref:CDP-diacylglycerol--glycerol-3-phosphate 3-phosphatidyltransferase n=1 Tax=Lapillicoccus jejuensis TaxID=402171 RepID=A0A542E3Z3_9MICO|nr:CDP-diacylglycerol--glycerol-3-phosphate 3-phosphatidyltransferase [Lapillicoccus jejuensis]TQJ10062.1 CDP-diacylglycerol--glycerol-3-phosphate 3-phosphatidyltransferase [Lapillicoccus jejuensis]